MHVTRRLGKSFGAGDLHENGMRNVNKIFDRTFLVYSYLEKDSCAAMERKEVIISNGNGLQSTKLLTDRIMAVCYVETVIRDERSGRERLK